MKIGTPTKKILELVIVLNILVFGAYGFLFWNIQNKEAQAGVLATEASQNATKDTALRSIKSSLTQNKGFITQIDTYFIPSDGAVTFINMLETLGKQSGVKMSIDSVNVTQDPAVAKDFKQTLHLRLITDGSWLNTFALLSTIENLPYRIEFEQVSLTLSGGSDSILYNGANISSPRTRAANESWNGIFDVTVLQLQ
jgi:Tfp pilus assembly protein PilO